MTRLQVLSQGSATRNSPAEAMKERTVAVLPAQIITNRSSPARLLPFDRAMPPIHSRNNPKPLNARGAKGAYRANEWAERADVRIPWGLDELRNAGDRRCNDAAQRNVTNLWCGYTNPTSR